MSDDDMLQLAELDDGKGGMSDLKAPQNAKELEAVYEIPVQVSAVLGRARMDVGELLNLAPGAVLELDRRVGESTSEVGACFLMRVLNLANHLGHEQITKSGLRMWFYRNSKDSFTRCAEIGPKHQTRLPAFQLDRSKLDEAVLLRAPAVN